MSAALATPRLARLARPEDSGAARAGISGAGGAQRCDLCALPVADGHRHLLDLASGGLRCACRACALLFDRPAAGNGELRLVPVRRWRLPDLDLAGTALRGVPVDLFFAFRDSAGDRLAALCPGPGGPVESPLAAGAWNGLVAANPVLEEMAPDVEALLVDRARGAREHWLVPIDDCYALTGLIRTRWKGLSGGAEVWRAVEEFRAGLRRRARTVPGRTAPGTGPPRDPHLSHRPHPADAAGPPGPGGSPRPDPADDHDPGPGGR